MKKEHLERQPLKVLLRRALKNRCPVCGEDRVFDGLWRMRHHCGDCTYVYEREQGYFLGAMYINYALTCALALTAFFTMTTVVDWPPLLHLCYVLPFTIGFPLLFSRHARLLWMVLDIFSSVPMPEDFLPDP